MYGSLGLDTDFTFLSTLHYSLQRCIACKILHYKHTSTTKQLAKSSIIRDSGRDPLDQNFRKFRYKIEWNRKFLKTRFENFGQRLEVALKFWKIGILGKSYSIPRFLLGPSFSQPGNRHGGHSSCSTLISARLVFLRQIALLLY